MIGGHGGKCGSLGAARTWPQPVGIWQTLLAIPLLALITSCALHGRFSSTPSVDRAYQSLAAAPMAPIGDRQTLDSYRRSSEQLQHALNVRHRTMDCQAGNQFSCQLLAVPARSRPGFMGLDAVEVVGSRIAPADIITNNQEAGVDEGDIVKKSGRFVLVLRQGWLHVFDTGTSAAPAVERIQSLQVATDPSGETVWYDEILAFDDRVVLLGFNFVEEVAELISYSMDGSGRLQREARYWIRVQDYYSASNYGARIEGDNLLLVLAMPIDVDGEDAWPVWSRRDGVSADWQPLVELEDVHLPVAVPIRPVIHLVVRCPLRQLQGDALDCRTVGVVGEENSSSYVSSQAVYLAVEYWPAHAVLDPTLDLLEWPDRHKGLRSTVVYRFPFAAGATIGFALFDGLTGTQFTFTERGSRFHAAMAEAAADAEVEPVLLLQSAAIEAFAPNISEPARARLDARQPLDPAQLSFRFTDQGLLVGPHSSVLLDEQLRLHEWRPVRPPRIARMPAMLLQPLDGSTAVAIQIGHSADQIEPVPGGVAVSGLDPAERWHVSVLAPTGSGLSRTTLALPKWRPDDSRSHAFNSVRRDDGTVLLGWPVTPWDIGVSPLDDGWYWQQRRRVADLAMLHWDGNRLGLAGVLDMQPNRTPPKCKSGWACWDWYGTARLFFFEGRIFLLSGPRLVEASWDGQALRPLRSAEMP
jgi:hypothetical protein